MTNTLHSINEYDYTGQNNFVAPSHQQASDIVVLVNDVVKTQGTDYTLTGSLVAFTGFTPSNGDKISIRRETASAARAVDFASGSMLKADTLDKDSNQIFFMAQEALDKAGMIGGDYNARYYGAATTAPTLPTPEAGDLWFDTSVNTMKVYRTDSGWQPTTSSVSNAVRRVSTTITSPQSTFSGGNYDVGNLDIYLNGVRLVGRVDANTPNDYTADDGSTFTLTTPAAAGDTIEVITYGTSPLLGVQTGAAGTDASYSSSTGILTIPRGDSPTTASVALAGAVMDGQFTSNGFMKRTGAGTYAIDSSTYATETYVGTAVSGLVDSAPATLDTLNELASALGDDNNFSTTVTNNLAGKANLTGANFTGNVTTTGTLATGGYTLSSTDGTSGQALVTDGSGNVSFGDVTVDVSGKADLSGATFTGDVTAKSKLIVNKQPVASDLLTTDRSIQDLAAWSAYGGATANYALTPEKYRDSFDVNQGNTFSGMNSYTILLFVSNNYTPNELSTFQSLINNPSNITSTFVQDVLDGDYDSLSTSAGVTVDRDASSIVTVSGDIAVSGTVDGRDVSTDGDKLDLIEASADVTDATSVASAGAAMLTGANFTGDVRIADDTELKFGDGANGDLRIFHTSSNNTSTIREQGSSHFRIQGQDLYLSDTSGGNYLYGQSGADVRLYFNGSEKLNTRDTGVNVTGDLTVTGTDSTDGDATFTGDVAATGATFTGDITLTGTVDGRDVATDGTKLDGLERTVRQRFQKRGYNSTLPLAPLTTTFTQLGDSLRINSGATTDVENVLDLNLTANFLDINNSNEGEFVITVDAPNPSDETTINLGTVVTSGMGTFKVAGDFTKHFSPYCGMSTNSNGSNAFTFANYESWWYDPTTDRTTVQFNPYQANTPSLGDTIYLHPFDWETSGTEIIGETYPIEAYNESSTISQNHFHQIYLGYYKPERTFKIKAKEIATSENIQITKVAGTYSQIIGG